jgi:hypothetical protein
MQNVLRHRLRPRGVESDNQLDGNVLPIQLVGDVEGGIRAERVADDDDDIFVPASVLVGDPMRDPL